MQHCTTVVLTPTDFWTNWGLLGSVNKRPNSSPDLPDWGECENGKSLNHFHSKFRKTGMFYFFFFTGFNIDYIKNVNMNIPQSPEARLVQVSLLPVWVETQLRPPRLPIASHPVLGFQNLTGNPERQYYDVKKVSFYWHIWEREGCHRVYLKPSNLSVTRF